MARVKKLSPRALPGWHEVKHFPQLLEFAEELIPLTTACEFIGLSPDTVQAAINRQPALSRMLKQARAKGLIKLQRDIASGAKSWQSLARIAESADPEHWLRAAPGRKSSASSAYAAMMAKRGGR